MSSKYFNICELARTRAARFGNIQIVVVQQDGSCDWDSLESWLELWPHELADAVEIRLFKPVGFMPSFALPQRETT